LSCSSYTLNSHIPEQAIYKQYLKVLTLLEPLLEGAQPRWQ